MWRADLENIATATDAPYFARGKAIKLLLKNNDYRLLWSGEGKYCREMLNMSVKSAYEYIALSDIYWTLRFHVRPFSKLPSEDHAALLKTIPMHQVAAAWESVLYDIRGGPLTLRALQLVCDRFNAANAAANEVPPSSA